MKKVDTTADEKEMFTKMLDELETMKKNIAGMITTLKASQKMFTKKSKTNVKSGFVKPVRLTKELSQLIGTEENELVARNVVNRKINEYVKAHNLQVPESRQNFVVDEALGKLFNLPTGTNVHYFKMQTYLKNHYPKTEVAVN